MIEGWMRFRAVTVVLQSAGGSYRSQVPSVALESPRATFSGSMT